MFETAKANRTLSHLPTVYLYLTSGVNYSTKLKFSCLPVFRIRIQIHTDPYYLRSPSYSIVQISMLIYYLDTSGSPKVRLR